MTQRKTQALAIVAQADNGIWLYAKDWNTTNPLDPTAEIVHVVMTPDPSLARVVYGLNDAHRVCEGIRPILALSGVGNVALVGR